MRSIKFALAVVAGYSSAPAFAAKVSDPTDDFIPSFVGTAKSRPRRDQLLVSLDPGATTFTLGAVLAGDINPALAGFYVIGVDAGSGAIRPFGAIGEPNVISIRCSLSQKTGTATLGANPSPSTWSATSSSSCPGVAVAVDRGHARQLRVQHLAALRATVAGNRQIPTSRRIMRCWHQRRVHRRAGAGELAVEAARAWPDRRRHALQAALEPMRP